MKQKYKNFEERYTREQTLKCSLVFSTYDFGYSPVVFINPEGFQQCISGEFVVCHYDLKAVYLLEIWKTAKSRTDEKFWRWDYAEWFYNPDDYFQKLEFYDYEETKKAVDFFWQELERLANSGEIIVEESYRQEANKKIWVLDCLGKKIERGSSPNFEENNPDNPKRRTWKWNEVKDFFIELAIPEIEFLHGKNLNQCCARDLPLLKACAKVDIQEMALAIRNGANVNALDKNGEGCLHKILDDCNYGNEYFEGDFSIVKDKKSNQKFMDAINLLLENGLDINLYGFDDGEDGILRAHWMHNVELMYFLIKKGARINQNSFITDLTDIEQSLISSATYDYVLTDLALGDFDNDELEEEEELLESCGIDFWAAGWDTDKVTAFFDDLWAKIIYE